MKRIILCFLILLAGQLFAQASADTVRFPIPLHPGDDFTVQSSYLTQEGVFDVSTLWLLKDSQLRTLAKKARKQPIDSTMAAVLEQQVALLKLIHTEKDSIISLNREGYLRYRDLWEETDRKLEEEEIRSSKRFKWGFYVGTAFTMATMAAVNLIFN